MAIIECPNCRGQISDRARKCVHCGTVFISEEKKFCAECGTELEDGLAMCFRCGCPVGADSGGMVSVDSQQMGTLSRKERGSGLKWLFAVVMALVIVLMALVIGILWYRVRIATEEVMRLSREIKTEEESVQRGQEYLDNLQLVTDTMLAGAVDAENCCNLIVQVWNNAIWEKEDDTTDQYTMTDGHFVEDFNDALNNLFADPEFSLQIDNIVENQAIVNSIVGQLKNPPEEYKSAHESLSECYDAYLTFTGLAVNPTGSLNTFSEDFENADTEFLHCYHVMEFYTQD